MKMMYGKPSHQKKINMFGWKKRLGELQFEVYSVSFDWNKVISCKTKQTFMVDMITSDQNQQ